MKEVLITSASRPDYLKQTLDSFLSMMESKEEFRFILHEDVLNKKRSDQVLRWAEDSKMFYKIIVTEPARRMGIAVYRCFPEIEGELFIRWEDDWLMNYKVDVDIIFNVMKSNLKINQIAFNQSSNEIYKHHFMKPEVIFPKFRAVLLSEWSVGPGVWRKSFITKYWGEIEDAHTITNRIGVGSNWDKAEWLVDNLGCYFYGGYGQGNLLKHIGINSAWFSPIEGKK